MLPRLLFGLIPRMSPVPRRLSILGEFSSEAAAATCASCSARSSRRDVAMRGWSVVPLEEAAPLVLPPPVSLPASVEVLCGLAGTFSRGPNGQICSLLEVGADLLDDDGLVAVVPRCDGIARCLYGALDVWLSWAAVSATVRGASAGPVLVHTLILVEEVADDAVDAVVDEAVGDVVADTVVGRAGIIGMGPAGFACHLSRSS